MFTRYEDPEFEPIEDIKEKYKQGNKDMFVLVGTSGDKRKKVWGCADKNDVHELTELSKELWDNKIGTYKMKV